MALKRSQTFFIFAILIGAIALFLLFREVFAGRFIINPIALSAGPFEIRWYGLIIAIGILLALEWTMRRAKVRGLDVALVERATFAAILGGIAGARLIYVAQNIHYFTLHSNRILALTDGGLSIHGALLGGALVLVISVWLQRKNHRHSEVSAEESRDPSPPLRMTMKEEVFRLMDAIVPGLLLAMILGRLGNFANAELFGPPTNLPWKLFIPVASRPAGLADVAFYHPTFLYDIILNSALLIGLLWLEHSWHKQSQPDSSTSVPTTSRGSDAQNDGKRIGLQPGQLTLWFFLGIAITRFIVEFWRLGDSAAFGLSLAQLVSILIALGAAIALIFSSRESKTTS